jgi:murein hydrolase activator
MRNTLNVALTCSMFLMWGSICFAQPSSTSPRLDVSLRNDEKNRPDGSKVLEDPSRNEAARLEKMLRALEAGKAELSADFSRAEGDCLELEGIIGRLARDTEADFYTLESRLVMLYKYRQMGYAALLISSEDVGGAVEAARSLSKLIESGDKVLLSIRARNAEMTGFRKILAGKTRERDILKSRVDAQEQSILAARKEQGELMRASQPAGAFSVAHTQMESPQDLFDGGAFKRKPIFDSPQTHFVDVQGALPLPTNGVITNTYGSKTIMPTLQSGLYKNGVLISAPEGQPVQAVYDGVVVFADWFKEYGKVLIIDHGEHFHSLLAHNDQLLKAVDERVKGGEVVATVGSTGSLDGPKLYFEIRHYGKPVDPMEWLAVRKLSEE